jgi:hypothetical protein
MGAAFLRKYNTAITAGTAQSVKIPMIKRGVVDQALGADWTPSAGDVKVSKDGGAAANIATLPAAVAMGNGAYWEFVFSGAEVSCGTLVVTIADSATKAVEDQMFIIETFGNASALYQWDMSLANLPANVTQLLGTAWLTPGTAGTPDVNAKLLGGTAQSTGDLSALLGTIAGYIDTEVAAIKTKTDFLPSVVAGGAGGLMIAGSNAALTLAALTVSGATTLTGALTASNASNNITGVHIESNLRKNQALAGYQFPMADAAGVLQTGLTDVTVYRSIDGGAFGVGTTANIAEIGSTGIYKVDYGAGDLNGKTVLCYATGTGCVTRIWLLLTDAA